MNEQRTFHGADRRRLATELDAVCAGWDEGDRRLRYAVFARAGEASAARCGEEDVGGFRFDPDVWFDDPGAEVQGNLVDSFQWGVRRGSPGGTIAQG